MNSDTSASSRGSSSSSEELGLQTANNTKAQFANSPTLRAELLNAVMDALAAHSTMSKQALELERVREGLKDVLLGPAQLYECCGRRRGKRLCFNWALGRDRPFAGDRRILARCGASRPRQRDSFRLPAAPYT